MKSTDIYKADLAHWYALETNNKKTKELKTNFISKLKYSFYEALKVSLINSWPNQVIINDPIIYFL
jgi:hypothetical protein